MCFSLYVVLFDQFYHGFIIMDIQINLHVDP